MDRKRIVVIDSDPGFSNIYTHLVESLDDFELLRVYRDMEDSLARLTLDRPDIILVGLESIYNDKIEMIRKFRNKDQYAEIIIIADFADDNLLFKAISYGVSGFLLRISPLLELEDALKAVSVGGGYLNGQVARKLVESFHRNSSSPLTPRETQVINCLANGKTYTMIASEMEIARETVKTHIKNIYDKLNVNTKAGAIAKALDYKLLG